MTLRRAAKSLFIRGKNILKVRTEDAVVKATTYMHILKKLFLLLKKHGNVCERIF